SRCVLLTHAMDRSSHCTTSSSRHIKSEWGISVRISALLIDMLSGVTQNCLLNFACESDAMTHRTPKHFVRNHMERLFHFAPAFGVRTCPCVTLASLVELPRPLAVTFAETSLVPERINVEPIARRETRIMLQPRDVALHPRLNLLGTMFPIQYDLVGERFEANVIAVPAAVEAEKQDDGAMHHGSKQNRPGRQGGGRAKEVTTRCFLGAENAIA